MDGQAEKQSSIAATVSFMLSARHNPAAAIFNADLLMVLIAASLPWSTSIPAILVPLWLVALAFTLDWREFLVSLKRPICWLPIALFGLALIGTLWSDAPWAARLHAVSPAAKLLVLPALLYHFERTPRGRWVFIAFLVSCTLLAAVSWLVMMEPELTLKQDKLERGIFVKNYIDQSQEFALCVVVLAYPIFTLFRDGKAGQALLLCSVALGLLANMAFVTVSRTTIVTMPVMLAAFALLHLRWRTSPMILGALVALAGLAWAGSPQLRHTAEKSFSEYRLYMESNTPTSLGLRLEYWRKSLRFVADAPLIGHGTGSTRQLFEQAAVGANNSASADVVSNPHNQTLNVAVQWGAIGVIVLYAMWGAHLLLFRGEGFMVWVGLMVVVQNILSSLFNSHLFDFHEGWMYVLGVGVAGGTMLGERVKSDPPHV